MIDWQQRVIDEKSELDEKLKKLGELIGDKGKFSQLERVDCDLLVRQEGVMRTYANILQKRIDRFTEGA